MTTIKPEDVEHIATLARLLLTPEETEKFSAQLTSILEYMTKLNEVNTDAVEPTRQVTELVNRFRDDVVSPQDTEIRDALLRGAPKREADGFQVPTVLQE